MDIVCHHTGTLEMFEAMTEWSAIDQFRQTETSIYQVNGETAGYLRSVQNLRLLAIRNASHMAPRKQPEVAFQMFSQFLSGSL